MFHLEALPDEILLDLFENYIRLIDIHIAFYPLPNQRINTLIRAARLWIDIPSKDIFHAVSFTAFAPQIVSLHLSRCCKDLDLSKFVNLRLLHIEKPTHIQLLAIQSSVLPQLQYLSLHPCWYSKSELPNTLGNIDMSCSFKHLRYCVLPNGQIIRFSAQSQAQ
ncbi:unnamed protein product [Adineta ricciae]|uniref:Uncharacterized protein n=1 Tax=Adineta ricciae TaxID=249248 RepID=A0A815SG57_ADIRI|nr:unnamed protein product [Adineta ricciae]